MAKAGHHLTGPIKASQVNDRPLGPNESYEKSYNIFASFSV